MSVYCRSKEDIMEARNNPNYIVNELEVRDSVLSPDEFARAMTLLEDIEALWSTLPPDEARERRRVYDLAQRSVVEAKSGMTPTAFRVGSAAIRLSNKPS